MNAFFEDVMPVVFSILKALLLILAAFIVAAIAKKLVTMLLKRLMPKKLSEKNPEFCKSMVVFVGKAVYLVVFLLFVPGVFALMGAEGAAKPIVSMLEGVLAFIPNIIVAILIVYIGIMLSKLAGAVVESLVKMSNLDESMACIIPAKGRTLPISKYSKLFTEILLIIFFVVQAVDVLGLKIFDGIGAAIIGYIPSVIAGVLIFVGCFLLDSILGSVFKRKGHHGAEMLVKVMVYVVGIFMILSQLGIASYIVNSAFVIIVAGVSVAFALAFGIGGRNFASEILENLKASWGNKK